MFALKRSLYIVLLFFLYSCTQEEIVKSNSNFPLKAGNYWIYRTTFTSADGVVQVFPYLDSVWIQKDTLINHKKYWKQIQSLSGTVYLRDSSDCLLMKKLTYEQIIFSTNRDTLLKTPPLYKLVTNVNEHTKVPAGEFITNDCRTLLRKGPLNTGFDAYFPSFGKDFYTAEHYLCSKNVGLVKNIYYYLGNTIEYELVRYKLK